MKLSLAPCCLLSISRHVSILIFFKTMCVCIRFTVTYVFNTRAALNASHWNLSFWIHLFFYCWHTAILHSYCCVTFIKIFPFFIWLIIWNIFFLGAIRLMYLYLSLLSDDVSRTRLRSAFLELRSVLSLNNNNIILNFFYFFVG